MNKRDTASPIYLSDGTRILVGPAGQYRFRKGVWSHVEALVDLRTHGERLLTLFALICDQLRSAGVCDWRALARPELPESELSVLDGVVALLTDRQFVSTTPSGGMGKAIVGILGNEGPEFHRGSGTARPIVLLTDSAYGRQCARQLANDLGLPLEIVSEDVQKSLRSIDLTSRLDAVAQGRLIERFKPYFAQCAAVLGSFVDPDIPLLRNLNRLLVELEKPLVLGLIDGPFLTVISTKPPQTGCFECFEHRILARLEDSQAYEAYVSAQRGAEGSGDATSHSDALTAHLLTTAVLAEGVLYATLGMSRLAGRCASIYRPLLEVQMQDLLRVPYCPACGNISRLKMRELYVSSRAIVKHLLSGVELDKSE